MLLLCGSFIGMKFTVLCRLTHFTHSEVLSPKLPSLSWGVRKMVIESLSVFNLQHLLISTSLSLRDLSVFSSAGNSATKSHSKGGKKLSPDPQNYMDGCNFMLQYFIPWEWNTRIRKQMTFGNTLHAVVKLDTQSGLVWYSNAFLEYCKM